MIDGKKVAVIRQPPVYEPSLVRASIEQAITSLGLSWSELIKPGERILLKPNFVRESHTERPEEWEHIITHGTVIAEVAMAVARALDGNGTITIADAPQTDSNFVKICQRTRLLELQSILQAQYPALIVEILDLRREYWETHNGLTVNRHKLPEDPRAYALVDLGEDSCFSDKSGIFYGADYDTNLTARHHSNGRHEYLIARSALDADVFINLPKLKTHKKVGVTLSLKNLVGINGDKNYLPHFCIGTPDQGGDEFPNSHLTTKVQSRLIMGFKKAAKLSGPLTKIWGPSAIRLGSSLFGKTNEVVRSGNWHGNDTTWRMTLDLNRILFHFDGTEKPRTTPLRYLSIIDGIIAGEGNGPMEADAKACGVLIAGTNPVATDLVATKLMGFHWKKIPTITQAFRLSEYPLVNFTPDSIEVLPEWGEFFQFIPHFGWKGHIEQLTRSNDVHGLGLEGL